MEGNKGIVLDTDVLVDLLRGRDKAVTLIRKLLDSRVNLATTAINIFELSWAAYKLGEEKVRDIERLIDTLTILGLTGNSAMKAGEEIAYLETLGLKIDIRDLLIGVVIREINYAIITGNLKHFKRIRDLKTIHYS